MTTREQTDRAALAYLTDAGTQVPHAQIEAEVPGRPEAVAAAVARLAGRDLVVISWAVVDRAEGLARPVAQATPLGHVLAAQHRIEAAQEALRSMVAYARAQGSSWGQIGAALGIARQSAAERFADVEEG